MIIIVYLARTIAQYQTGITTCSLIMLVNGMSGQSELFGLFLVSLIDVNNSQC